MLIEESLLASIYKLPRLPSNPIQDEASCENFKNIFHFVLKPLFEEGAPMPKWCSESEFLWLKSSKSLFEQTYDNLSFRFLPEYGSAVLLHSHPLQVPGNFTVTLLGLDTHVFEMHSNNSTESANGYDHIGSPTDYKALGSGEILKSNQEIFFKRLDEYLSKVKERVQGDRSSFGGKQQGHQYTPALIHGLLKQAVSCACECEQKCSCPEIPPRGGFTDNGLHTGGLIRNTSYPLIRSLFNWWLVQQGDTNNHLFHKTMLFFDLRILENQIRHIVEKEKESPPKCFPEKGVELRRLLEHAVGILNVASKKGITLADQNLPVDSLYEVAEEYGSQINNIASFIASNEAKDYILPDLKEELLTDSFRHFTLKLPSEKASPETTLSLKERQNRAARNIGHIEILIDSSYFDLRIIHRWVESKKEKAMSQTAQLLLLRTIENVFWERSKMGLEVNPLTEDEIVLLLEIVNSYRSIKEDMRKKGDLDNFLRTEQNSRELLLLWIAYCLTFQSARNEFPESMGNIGVALHYEDLQHLVFSDKQSFEVLKNVAIFLRKNFVKDNELFSLRSSQTTFVVAQRYSEYHLSEIWRQEKADAKARVDGHWYEVQRKQEHARVLRQEKRSLEKELHTAESHLEQARQDRIYCSRYDYPTKDRIVCREQDEVDELKKKISAKKRSIVEAEKPPAPVYQPLPLSESKAHQVLFFYFMPKLFRVLAEFSFTGQQLLIPRSWTSVSYNGNIQSKTIRILDKLKSEAPVESMKDYYNNKQNCIYHYLGRPRNGEEGHVLLRPHEELESVMPKHVGPKHIDQCTRENGIWYPDKWTPRFAWTGGPNNWDHPCPKVEFNPFLVEKDWICDHFTEDLGCTTMQWAMLQRRESPTDRGNLALATQEKRPNWLANRTEYLSFCKVRDFPNKQIRNVLSCFQEHSLPFSDHRVHLLLSQALYQVGKVGFDSTSKFRIYWKHDLLDLKGFMTGADTILRHLATAIEQSPTNYRVAMFMGEVASFLSGWNPACNEIARNMSDSCYEWAEDIGRQAGSAEGVAFFDLRAKQCILYRQAVLCRAKGGVVKSDVSMILQMLVKSSNLCSHPSTKDVSNELNGLKIKCRNAMAQHLESLISIVSQDPATLLSNAVGAVIKRVPESILWSRFDRQNAEASCCFEGVGSDDCLYSINILTGVVLVDGMPPSTLPSEIREHDLYCRIFGPDTNFEVVPKSGLLETIGSFDGFVYQFFLTSDGILHVNEISYLDNTHRELLDARPEEIAQWGAPIPQRLREMHSHWLCRKAGVVLLRGINFSDRSISFVFQIQSSSWDSLVDAKCRCVPSYLQSKSHDDIFKVIKNFDCLVLHDSKVTSVLEKFEDRKFIHVLRKGDQQNVSETKTIFHLPRFGLTFIYKDCFLWNEEHSGFKLHPMQQLEDMLRGFTPYLVLESRETKAIIVPDGELFLNKTGSSRVKRADKSSATCHFYMYDIHSRFGNLQARDICGRLQLVALHTITSTLVKDPGTGMTGEEQAIEQLRRCWVDRPLKPEEMAALRNVTTACLGMYPALSLLCRNLLQSSNQVSFLFPESRISEGNLKNYYDEESCYLSEFPISNRRRLTPLEEKRILGQSHRHLKALQRPLDATLQVGKPPISTKDVTLLEEKIFDLAILKKNENVLQDFPLARKERQTQLEADTYEELSKSWSDHIETLRNVYHVKENAKEVIGILKKTVEAKRKTSEIFLLKSISEFPPNSHSQALGRKFSRLANIVPSATQVDLLEIACRQVSISFLNPLLSKTAQDTLLDSIIQWLRLCVLEDKLNRLAFFIQTKEEAQFLRELLVRRVWKASKYPAWVVLEATEKIQIRPDQVIIAKHLLRHPQHIVQLNMGLGKTRVILPMLVLHWAIHDQKNAQISRLHVPSALFSENYYFFHQSLSASCFKLKVFSLPICRDIDLDEHQIAAIDGLVQYCKNEKGIFIVAPEHRLSLELKWKEKSLLGKAESDVLSKQIRDICENSNWRDIFDESDFLLHHRYQLIYAMGEVQELPEGAHRWQAAQSLLDIIQSDKNIKIWFEKYSGFAVFNQETNLEAFRGLRITNTPAVKSAMSEFRSKLVRGLVSKPPYQLDWLKNHQRDDEIFAYLTEPKEGSLEGFPDEHRNDLLAIRGLLAADVLAHCLQKRHRVDYGICRPGKKRICVPFRGADTPSLRSEFAHPDCTIVLTTLSYYSDGLNSKQVREAFETLFRLGKNAQRTLYSQWYNQVRDRMQTESSDLCEKLDIIEKIDLSNQSQFEFLRNYFSKNMKTINFWLNSCVFPEEMQQYPKRLTATSWDIAENETVRAVGFSGTNDNHRILPLQVKQYFPSHGDTLKPVERQEWKKIIGTNGKMLDVILKRAVECIELKSGNSCDRMLELVEERTGMIEAIIDCGAYLAGVPNVEVAKRLLDAVTINGNSKFTGIVFFDNSDKQGEWKASEPCGRLLPKNQSPVREDEAFALFDEPRCRGSDLKLSSTARAVLTIGPGMCKDAFMQAAGRMRKLEQGQKLLLVGTKDVFDEIRGATNKSDITAREILEWAMANTINATAEGMPVWANQGFFHCTTKGKPENSVEDERLSLEDFYGNSLEDSNMAKTVTSSRAYHVGRTGSEDLSERNSDLITKIYEKAVRYGDYKIQTSTGADEECERELELECEIEEEREIEIKAMKPIHETDWEWRCVFTVNSPLCLPAKCGVKALSEFVASKLTPNSLTRIGWTKKVFGTDNFFQSVRNAGNNLPKDLSHYLRMVDVVLYFSKTREALLVSDREADKLIPYFWEQRELQQNDHFGAGNEEEGLILFHLHFVRNALDGHISEDFKTNLLALCSEGANRGTRIGEDLMAELQLFAGETTYRTHNRKKYLKEKLLARRHHHPPTTATATTHHLSASSEPEHLVAMRGCTHLLPYSDLEKICKELAREDSDLAS